MKYNLEDKILLKLSLNLQMHTDSWSLIGMGIEGRDCKDILKKAFIALILDNLKSGSFKSKSRIEQR